ncbi:MAG: helix-turn-helix transcriptional regulator [Erysipelotrichaceae bacterium]|nr:helix-turn-helix transcriptional regulator [Erysipelotrichaceae bacterium]
MHDLYPSGIVYRRDTGEDVYGLTKREEEIAELLGRPLNTADIAEKLCISENTLNRHIANIYRKTSVHSRLELIGVLKNLDKGK